MKKPTRIYSDKYYITESTPGISGFKRWNEREYRVMRGVLAKNSRREVVAEFLFKGGKFRVENGSLPEYQPTTEDQTDLYQYLDANLRAVILNPEVYGLRSRA